MKDNKQIIVEPQLLAQASWWGSRAWARLGLLGLGKQRKLRLQMIGFANESIHDLYSIENNLTNRKDDGVARAVRSLLKLMNEYTHHFVPTYNELLTEMATVVQDDKPSVGDVGEDGTGEDTVYTEPVDKGTPKQGPTRQRDGGDGPDEPQPDKHSKPTEAENLHVNFEGKRKGLAWFESKLPIILVHKQTPSALKRNAQSHYNNLKTLIDLTATVGETEVHYQRVRRAYYEAVATFKHIGALFGSFDKMKEDNEQAAAGGQSDPFSNDGGTQASSNVELQKIAYNAFTRWFNRKIMGLSSKKINMMKLQVVEGIQDLIKALEGLMDILEAKHSTSNSIIDAFNNISRSLSDTGKKMWPLGKNHLLTQDTVKVKKNVPFLKLNTKQLKDLEDQSQSVLGKGTVPEITRAIKQLSEDIEPIFNHINVKLYPGGVLFDVKPLTREDGVTFIGIIVKPNAYIAKQQIGQYPNKNVLQEWRNIKKYILGSFKNKITSKYSTQLGHTVNVYVLDDVD